MLKHKPTNIVVKCQPTRSLPKNREEARRIMITKLDNFYNKEDSVENQRKRLERAKSIKNQSRSEKLRNIKMEFKKNLAENKSNEVE